nr:hypothetical protein [Deltaproteobacteria bacterium]
MTASAQGLPARAVLRIAGVLTQLIGAGSLLLGTIAFVLIQQNQSGGAGYVLAWAGAAMAALVLGGLMARGELISVLGSAALDAGFGIVLLVLDEAVLRGLVRVLPASDLEMIAGILVGAGGAMLAVAGLCLLAIPQALRYARWLQARADEDTPLRPSQPTQQLRALDSVLAGSTAKGWAPPPTTKLSVWNMPAASRAETRSRRRLYFALAGFAIGFGAGIGVLVSSAARPSKRPARIARVGSAGSAGATGAAVG